MESLDQLRKGTTTLAILKLLADAPAPMHGYEIARALEQRSHGSFRFQEGLVYPRLHQLEQAGLLEAEWVGEAGGRRRKVYRPTDAGRQRLVDDLDRWRAFQLGMERLLGADG